MCMIDEEAINISEQWIMSTRQPCKINLANHTLFAKISILISNKLSYFHNKILRFWKLRHNYVQIMQKLILIHTYE